MGMGRDDRIGGIGFCAAAGCLEAALCGCRVGFGPVVGPDVHVFGGHALPAGGADIGVEVTCRVGVHHIHRQGQHAQTGACAAVGKGDGLAFRFHIHRVISYNGSAGNVGIRRGIGNGVGGIHLRADDADIAACIAAADDRFRTIRVFNRVRVPLVQVGVDVHIVCVQLHAGDECVLLRCQNRRKHVCRNGNAADCHIRAGHVGNCLGFAVRFHSDITADVNLSAAGNAGIGHRAGSGVGQVQAHISAGNTKLGHQNAGFGVVGVVGGDIQLAHPHHVVITGVELGFKEAVGSGVHLHYARTGQTAGQSRGSIAGHCHGVTLGLNRQITGILIRPTQAIDRAVIHNRPHSGIRNRRGTVDLNADQADLHSRAAELRVGAACGFAAVIPVIVGGDGDVAIGIQGGIGDPAFLCAGELCDNHVGSNARHAGVKLRRSDSGVGIRHTVGVDIQALGAVVIDVAALLAAVQTHDDRGTGFRVSHVYINIDFADAKVGSTGFGIGCGGRRGGDIQRVDIHVIAANRSLEGTQRLGNQDIEGHGIKGHAVRHANIRIGIGGTASVHMETGRFNGCADTQPLYPRDVGHISDGCCHANISADQARSDSSAAHGCLCAGGIRVVNNGIHSNLIVSHHAYAFQEGVLLRLQQGIHDICGNFDGADIQRRCSFACCSGGCTVDINVDGSGLHGAGALDTGVCHRAVDRTGDVGTDAVRAGLHTAGRCHDIGLRRGSVINHDGQAAVNIQLAVILFVVNQLRICFKDASCKGIQLGNARIRKAEIGLRLDQSRCCLYVAACKEGQAARLHSAVQNICPNSRVSSRNGTVNLNARQRDVLTGRVQCRRRALIHLRTKADSARRYHIGIADIDVLFTLHPGADHIGSHIGAAQAGVRTAHAGAGGVGSTRREGQIRGAGVVDLAAFNTSIHAGAVVRKGQIGLYLHQACVHRTIGRAGIGSGGRVGIRGNLQSLQVHDAAAGFRREGAGALGDQNVHAEGSQIQADICLANISSGNGRTVAGNLQAGRCVHCTHGRVGNLGDAGYSSGRNRCADTRAHQICADAGTTDVSGRRFFSVLIKGGGHFHAGIAADGGAVDDGPLGCAEGRGVDVGCDVDAADRDLGLLIGSLGLAVAGHLHDDLPGGGSHRTITTNLGLGNGLRHCGGNVGVIAVGSQGSPYAAIGLTGYRIGLAFVGGIHRDGTGADTGVLLGVHKASEVTGRGGGHVVQTHRHVTQSGGNRHVRIGNAGAVGGYIQRSGLCQVRAAEESMAAHIRHGNRHVDVGSDSGNGNGNGQIRLLMQGFRQQVAVLAQGCVRGGILAVFRCFVGIAGDGDCSVSTQCAAGNTRALLGCQGGNRNVGGHSNRSDREVGLAHIGIRLDDAGVGNGNIACIALTGDFSYIDRSGAFDAGLGNGVRKGNSDVCADAGQTAGDARARGNDFGRRHVPIIRRDAQVAGNGRGPADLENRVEGTSCLGSAAHQAHRHGSDGQIVHIHIGEGIASCGNIDTAGGRDAGNIHNGVAGCVSSRNSGIGVDGQHTRGGAEEEHFRHLRVADMLLTAALRIGIVQIIASVRCFHILTAPHIQAGNADTALRLQLGFLLAVDGCQCHGHVGSDTADGRVGHDGIGTSFAIGVDVQAASRHRQASVKAAQNLGKVLGAVDGDGKVDRSSHTSGRTGGHDYLSLRFVRIILIFAAADRQAARPEGGAGVVNQRLISAGKVRQGNRRAHTHSTANHAGADVCGVAVHHGSDVHRAGGIDIDLVDGRKAGNPVDAQGHQTVDRHAASRQAQSVDVNVAGNGILHIHRRSMDGANIGSNASSFSGFIRDNGSATDVRAAVGIGNHDHGTDAHTNCAGCHADNPALSFRREGGHYIDIRCIDGDALPNVGIDIRIVDCAGQVHAYAHAAGCHAGRSGGGLGRAAGGHADAADLAVCRANLCVADDCRDDLPLKHRHAHGRADAHSARADAQGTGQHLVVVHGCVHFDRAGLQHVAREGSAALAEYHQNARRHADTYRAAADSNADQAHLRAGGLGAELFGRKILNLTEVVRRRMSGSFHRAAVGLNRNTALGRQLRPVFHSGSDLAVQHGNGEARAHTGGAADGDGAGDAVQIQNIRRKNADITIGSGHFAAAVNHSLGSIQQIFRFAGRQLLSVRRLVVAVFVHGAAAGTGFVGIFRADQVGHNRHRVIIGASQCLACSVIPAQMLLQTVVQIALGIVVAIVSLSNDILRGVIASAEGILIDIVGFVGTVFVLIKRMGLAGVHQLCRVHSGIHHAVAQLKPHIVLLVQADTIQLVDQIGLTVDDLGNLHFLIRVLRIGLHDRNGIVGFVTIYPDQGFILVIGEPLGILGDFVDDPVAGFVHCLSQFVGADLRGHQNTVLEDVVGLAIDLGSTRFVFVEDFVTDVDAPLDRFPIALAVAAILLGAFRHAAVFVRSQQGIQRLTGFMAIQRILIASVKRGVNLGLGIHGTLGVELVVCVLAHERASHSNGQGDSHSTNTTAGGCCHIILDVPVAGSGDDDALRGVQCILLSNHGADIIVGNADQRADRDAHTAGQCGRNNHSHQVVLVSCLNGDIAAGDGDVIAGIGKGLHLGHDHVQGAAHAGGAARADAGSVSGDKFFGGGANRDVIVGIDGSAGNCAFGMIVEVGHNRHGHRAGASANSHTRADVNQRGIGVRQNIHLAGCLQCRSHAQQGLGHALEYQHIHVACNAHTSATRKGHRQQDHGIIGIGAYTYIAVDRYSAQLLRQGFHGLVDNHCHNCGARASAAGNRQCAGKQEYVRVVVGIHGQIACFIGCRFGTNGYRNALAQFSLDLIGHHQCADGTRSREALGSGSARHARHDDGLMSICSDSDAPAAVIAALVNAGGNAGFAKVLLGAMGNQGSTRANDGVDVIADYRGANGCADGVAASTQRTGKEVVAAIQIGKDADRVICFQSGVAAHGHICRGTAHGHRDGASNTAALRRNACGDAQNHGGIFALSLNQDIAILCGNPSPTQFNSCFPLDDVHQQGRAHAGSHSADGSRDAAGHQQAADVGSDLYVLIRGDARIVGSEDIRLLQVYYHANGTGSRQVSTGLGRRRGSDEVHQCFVTVRMDADGASSAFQLGTAHIGLCLGLVYNHGDGAAHGSLAACGRGQGHQQLEQVRRRADIQIALSADDGSTADGIVDTVVQRNTVQRAAHRQGGSGTGTDGRSNRNHHHIGILPCLLVIVAARNGDGRVIAYRNRHHILVLQEAHGEAHARLGRRNAERTGKNTDIGIVKGSENHAFHIGLIQLLGTEHGKVHAGIHQLVAALAVHTTMVDVEHTVSSGINVIGNGIDCLGFCSLLRLQNVERQPGFTHCAVIGLIKQLATLFIVQVSVRILIDIVLGAGKGNVHVVTNRSGHFVAEEDHGNGTGHRGGGIRALVRHYGAGNGFRVVVCRAEHVQCVHHLHRILGAHVDGDLVGFVFLTLVQIHKALVGIFQLFAFQTGAVSDEVGQANSAAVVAEVHPLLVCGDLQAGALNAGKLADFRIHHIVAVDQSEGCANTRLGAFGQAHAAGAQRQLGLICGGQDDLAALNGNVILRIRIGDAHHNGGLCVVHNDGNGTCKADITVRTADRTGQGLACQQAAVLAVHVLGQVCTDIDVAIVGIALVARSNHITSNGHDRFILIHADGDAGSDGVCLSRNAHGRAGTSGAEVTVILRQDGDGLSLNAAQHIGICLVCGHVQTHSSCYLELLAVQLACAADSGGAGIGIALRNALIGGIGCPIASLTLHVLAAQNVDGQRHIAVGLGTAGVLMLIQGIVHLLGILIGRCGGLLLCGLVEIGAVQQFICRILGSGRTAAELIQVTVYVRAHSGGKGLRVVTVLCNRRNPGCAGSGNTALHQRSNVGLHHVHGDGGANSRFLSGSKGAGLGQGSAGLGRSLVEADILRLIYRMGGRIVLHSLHIVAAGEDYDGIFANVGQKGVLRNGDGCCRVQRNALLGLGCVGAGLPVLIGNRIAGVQRIGARHAGGGDSMIGVSPDVQRLGSHAAVLADARSDGYIGIGHGKARAHTDGLAGGIGGCILCCSTGSKGRADLRVGLRHVEQVSDAAVRIHNGVVRGGDGLLLLDTIHFIVEVQGFQLIAGSRFHDDRDPILVLRKDLGGSFIRAPEAVHIHQLNGTGKGIGIVRAGNVVLIDIGVGLVLRVVAGGACSLDCALAVGLCPGGSAGDSLLTDTHFQRGDEVHGEDSVCAFLQFHLSAAVEPDEVTGLSVCRHGSGREGKGNGCSAALNQIDGRASLTAAGQIQSVGANLAADLVQLRRGNGDRVFLSGFVTGGSGCGRTDGCAAAAFPNHVQQIGADAVFRQEAHRVLELGTGLHFLGCAAHSKGGLFHSVCFGGNGDARNSKGVAGQRNGKGLTLRTIGFHVSVGHPLDLHARVGRQGYGVAGNGCATASPHSNLRVFAGDSCGRSVGIAGGGIGRAAVQITVGFSAAVFRSGCNGNFVMVAVGSDGQAVANGNRTGSRPGSIHSRDGGVGIAVNHSNCHAACHTDAGGAGAGNGTGADGMSIRRFLLFQLGIQRACDLVDGSIGQGLARIADSSGQISPNGLGRVATQESGQGVHVHQAFGQHIDGIVDERRSGCCQRVLNLGRSRVGAGCVQQNHTFGQHRCRDGIDLCDDILFHLVEGSLHDFGQRRCETGFDGIQVQAALKCIAQCGGRHDARLGQQCCTDGGPQVFLNVTGQALLHILNQLVHVCGFVAQCCLCGSL